MRRAFSRASAPWGVVLMASNRSRFEQLLDKYEPVLKTALLDAIADIRSHVVLRRLVERLERGGVAGAINVLGIE